MNALTRLLLMAAVVVGACAVAHRFTPHHSTDNVFTTLYMHVMPTPLVKDPGAAHGAHADGGEHAVEAPGHGAEPVADHAAEGGQAAQGHGSDYLLSLNLPAALRLFDMDPAREGAQLLLTNLQIFQLAAVLLCIVAFAGLPGQIRSRRMDKVSGFFAGWAMWIRDEMVYPVMGKEEGAKYLPYFLSIFFFIVFMNLLGLVPWSATATASLAVTGALALTTFIAMIICGMAVQGPIAFWKHLVPHVPLPLWPLMFLVEVIGLVIKPFALMIRLFANMTGGHMVVLSFLGLIFFFGQKAPAVGYSISPIALAFAVFIMIIESFVALLQAYIFTQLSILFVGTSIHPEH
jgi:F-type H+-transporting ATPase subunit a